MITTLTSADKPKGTMNSISKYMAKIGSIGGKTVTPKKLAHLKRASEAAKIARQKKAKENS